MDLLIRQPDPVVHKHERRPRLAPGDHHLDRNLTAIIPWFELRAGPDRVHPVLKQLAQKDLRAAVQVLGKEIDDPAKMDLERVVHGRPPSRCTRGRIRSLRFAVDRK